MASLTIAASPCVNTGSINPRDDSFSSYLTLVRESFATEVRHTGRTRSSFQINSNRRRRSDDGEIDIFDAEKYFNGAMEYNTNILPEKELNLLPCKKDKKASAKSRSLRKTASTCSEASGNSRIGLLRQHSKAAKADGKNLLRVFLCTCSGKKTIDTEVEVESTRDSFGERNLMDEIRLASEMRMKRLELGFNEGLFNGPENLKGIEGKDAFRREFREGEKMVNLGTRESLNPSSETILSTSLNNRCNVDNYDDDISSESSSDLFEINSTSINSQSFFEPYMADSVVYEPSEASIDWSVMTASAANFSVASQSDESRKQRTKGSRNQKGLLMGCVSHKAVNVTTDSHQYKLTKRHNTVVEMPDMPVQFGHEGFVAPAMRYPLESLKMTESRATPQQHAMPPTRPISRIQARQPIYIRS